MKNKFDYHTFKTAKGIFVSIGQGETLREDFGPFHTYRKANAAAYREWRRQQAKGCSSDFRCSLFAE